MNQHIALLDDDKVFVQTLARRLSKKGLQTTSYHQLEELLASQHLFTHLLLDMNLGNDSILIQLANIRERWSQAQILILTGYASIATTVTAIKQGADDYLTKPIDFNSLLQKLTLSDKSTEPKQSARVLSAAQLEWEHIHQVLQQHDGNISAAARAMNMHRRTLQRKLQKKPVW